MRFDLLRVDGVQLARFLLHFRLLWLLPCCSIFCRVAARPSCFKHLDGRWHCLHHAVHLNATRLRCLGILLALKLALVALAAHVRLRATQRARDKVAELTHIFGLFRHARTRLSA